jgi:hypothetical protein
MQLAFLFLGTLFWFLPGDPPTRSATLLFDGTSPVPLTIEAPLKTILRDRSQESSEHPGRLILVLGETSDTFDVKIRTRGKTRLQRSVCGFPPLRLNLKKGQVEGTLFGGQDKLKLVTHCQDGRREYEQYVLQEYLIYRAYNLLQDVSFRVRLLHVTYVDTESDRDPITRYAFVIEDDDMLAARHGLESLEIPSLPPDFGDPDQVTLLSLFQFMIGNTDWSAFVREEDRRTCCHNTKPIGTMDGPVYPVPYDFDIAGVIDARYANSVYQPHRREQLSIRTVRERRYRGLCVFQPSLPTAIEVFNQKREEIYDLYRQQPALDPELLQRNLNYFDEFYDIINDEEKVKREIENWCRKT